MRCSKIKGIKKLEQVRWKNTEKAKFKVPTNDLPVTVAMLEPIAKDCVVAPAASDALINS